jgi:hypothetical protein
MPGQKRSRLDWEARPSSAWKRAAQRRQESTISSRQPRCQRESKSAPLSGFEKCTSASTLGLSRGGFGRPGASTGRSRALRRAPVASIPGAATGRGRLGAKGALSAPPLTRRSEATERERRARRRDRARAGGSSCP